MTPLRSSRTFLLVRVSHRTTIYVIDAYPVLAHELVENAVNAIYNDSFEKATAMLRKGRQLLDQLCVGSCNKSATMSLIISHNLALCYQKAGQLAECGACLKQCLTQVKKMVTPNDSPETKFKHLKYLSKLHMQYCAILSQQNRHNEALDHAKYGIRYSHEMITQTMHVAEGYAAVPSDYSSVHNDVPSRKPKNASFGTDCSALLSRPLGEPAELTELFAKKLLPVLRELVSRFVSEDSRSGDPDEKKRTAGPGLDVRNLFGYMQSSDWIANLNIGNIMQVSPVTLQDLVATYDVDIELTRETLLEKVALLSVAYFCVSTEKRFLAQEPASRNSSFAKQSEFWHAKALEIACCFLPAECPLVNHIFSSYQKHHSPLQQAIVNTLCYHAPISQKMPRLTRTSRSFGLSPAPPPSPSSPSSVPSPPAGLFLARSGQRSSA